MNPTHVKNLLAGVIFVCLFSLAGIARETGSCLNSTNSIAFRLPPPIPLTLIYFNLANTTAGKVELQWKTAQEINVSHFNIERSLDGKYWTKVGHIKATGREGSIQTYIYTDMSAPSNVAYYRLQVVDDDARSDYSPVRLITSNAEVEVRIYPTLTSSNSTVFIEGISPENAMVELFGTSGKVYNKIKMYSNTIALPGIPPGIYQVRITSLITKSTVCLQKIVIY